MAKPHKRCTTQIIRAVPRKFEQGEITRITFIILENEYY
jgi:hypothetical protein